MNKSFVIIIISLVLAGCVAVGKQTIKVENKILAPKIVSINKFSGPWMGEIERRLQKAGFKVIYSSVAGQRTVISSDSKFKYNQASTQYFLAIDAAAPTDFARRCFGGGYNFDYIYANLIDTKTGETIASIESRGYSEGCPPLNGSIYKNITKMVSDSWHPKIKNQFGDTSSQSENLTQEKAIKDFLIGRKLDPIEGIWGSGRAIFVIKKNKDFFEEITIKSTSGLTKNGYKFGMFKKISNNNYKGESDFYRRENNITTKSTCKSSIQILDIDRFLRVCTPDLTKFKTESRENYRLWPENFEQYNSSIKN